MKKKSTKEINIGGVCIGGNNPIAIQTMNTSDTRDVESTLNQINDFYEAGCDITRVAIPDMKAAKALSKIVEKSPLPVVADIHFDYRLALESIENGASKIRINPGNLGNEERVRAVAKKANEYKIPIRVGVNSGSLSQAVIKKFGGVNCDSMSYSALEAIRSLEKENFDDIVISIKSSNPLLTIESCRLLSQKTNYPLHIGVTEAGTLKSGLIKSSVGIGTLLAEGIGDTIRVSLTCDPIEEVYAAKSILKALGLRKGGIELVSCPTCGRTEVPLIDLAEKVEKSVRNLPYDLKIAVMGCAVNGPGEAREADIGIAGGKNEFLIFKKGKPIKKVSSEKALEELLKEIHYIGEKKK